MIEVLTSSVIAVFVYMTIWFIGACLYKDMSIVDAAWGLGFIMIAWLTFLSYGSWLPRQILVTWLITLWGARLSIHIYMRSKFRGEDFRYKEMRRKWGKHTVLQSFFHVFMLQGLVMLIVALPIMFVNGSSNASLGLIEYVGAALWVLGFYFESVGDYQLYKFKQKKVNRARIMRKGLWQYSRHPNYFGEVLIWWGIFLIAGTVDMRAIVSPVLLTYLMLHVTGVKCLERKYKKHKQFQNYAAKTNCLIPWSRKMEGW